MTNSRDLLIAYAETGSETSFRHLVDAYIGLVYSTASRILGGDRHLAEDVAQSVFSDLARSADKLSSDVMLGGWLHRHTCFVALKVLRGERRRQARERQAIEMSTLHGEPQMDLRDAAPVLDEAIEQLELEDRKAILLRFFDQHDFRAVGKTLGSSENAARMRVNRALDKLASLLKARGVTFPAAALGAALASHAVTAAPAGFASAVSTAALTAAASGSSLLALKFMAITKLHTAVAGALLVAGIATPLVIQQRKESEALRREQSLLQTQVAALQRLRDDNLRLSNMVAAVAERPEADADLRRELLRLRGEVGRARLDTAELSGLKTAITRQDEQTAEAFDAMSGLLEKGLAQASAHQSNTVVRRIDAMRDVLGLTPGQETALREIMLSGVNERAQLAQAEWAREITPEQRLSAVREGAATEEQRILALLSPEQRTAYDIFKQADAVNSARRSAASSAERMRDSLKLTPAQEQQVYAALYDLNLNTQGDVPDSANVLDSPDAIVRDQTARLETQLQTLSSVLTPEQWSRYRGQQLNQISNAAAAIKFMQAFHTRTNRATAAGNR